jgi:phosphoglycerate kinase
MCFTFLAALGHDVGASRLETSLVGEAKSLLSAHRSVELPSDLVALSPDGVLAVDGDPTGEVRAFERGLPRGWKGLDIGPGTRSAFATVIGTAATVLWNGPMGVFEDPRFAEGTRSIAEAVAACRGFSVVGGGETVAALHEYGLEDRIDHVSSGGGATLELIEKGDLPGLAALRASVLVAARMSHPRHE